MQDSIFIKYYVEILFNTAQAALNKTAIKSEKVPEMKQSDSSQNHQLTN
jgi:hypothetical protein